MSKNVKKINEKCTEDAKTIHLGFLMINYGTSREEFISYLMHPEHGYLIRNPLDKMDALVLFFNVCRHGFAYGRNPSAGTYFGIFK